MNLPDLLVLPTAESLAAFRGKLWTPNPGPQEAALTCQADILFYGGQAGGGKSDLLLGLARYQHQRSVIFRRVFPNLEALIDRSKVMYVQAGDASIKNFNAGHSRWNFPGGCSIRFASLQYESNVTNHQGQPRDLHGFDEITEFSEYQFRFVIAWNRSEDPNQRCRVVCTGNPPTTNDGQWVTKFWGPWLDPDHPNPAKPGELRFYTTINGKDVECPSGDPVEFDGMVVKPLSRTFIPAALKDNPYLMRTGYAATLQALPEPLRSQLLFGDFAIGRKDDAWQVIPSAWVEAAMNRWRQAEKDCAGKPKGRMTALGGDVARGGKDKSVLAPRYGIWFAPLIRHDGPDTPDGGAFAGLVLVHVKNRAQVVVDVVGVGASAYDFLQTNESVKAVAYNGAEKANKLDKSGTLKFVNKRAQDHWRLREALDPITGYGLMLPPDPELKADLCAPRWSYTPSGVLVESKDDIKERIGRSPDSGDSVIMSWSVDDDPETLLGELGIEDDHQKLNGDYDPLEEA